MVEKEVKIKYTLDSKNAEQKSTKLGGLFDKLKQRAKLVAVVGIGAITAGIIKMTNAYGKQEEAEVKLRSALEATGQEVANNAKELGRYASELQRMTTVGDEETLAIMQMGISMGLTAEQTKEATKNAIGLSKAYKIDTSSAMKATALAMNGNYNMLKRHIPALRNIKDESLLVSEANRLMGAGFKVAQAETQTVNGAMKQMGDAVGDLNEDIGKVFAPMIVSISQKIKWLAEWFTGLGENTKTFIVVLGTLSLVFLSLIPIIATLITTFAGLGLAMTLALLGIPALIALVITGFVLLAKNADKVKVFFQNAFDSIWIATNNLLMGVLGAVKKITDQLNKIPGVNIKTDKAIENLDALNEKLKEQIANRKAQNVEMDNLDKEQLDQLQANNEEKARLDEEARQKKLEEEKKLAEELKKLEADKLKATQEALAQRFQSEVENAQGLEEVSKSLMNTMFGYVKKYLIQTLFAEQFATMASISMSIAKHIAKGFLGIPEALGAMAQLAVPMAQTAVGVSAINALKLADGGSYVVDQPTMISNGVMAGEEKTPERVDVTPINQQKEQTIVLNVNVGEEKVITKMFKLGQRSRQEGYINDGLRRNF